MADVFLSYARPDEPRVRRIAELLMADGHDVWWDAELPPHRAYSEVIQEEMGRAKAVLVAWSKEALASEWVRAEADMARNAHKLVQVSLDDCDPPLPFNQIHYVKLADWHGARDGLEWQRILRSIAEILGRPAPMPSPGTRLKAAASAWGRWLRRRPGFIWAGALLLAVLLFGAGGVSGWLYSQGQLVPPDRHSKIGFIFPDSDTRLITGQELSALSREQLALARNEIYARRGHYFFKKSYFREYYSLLPWYIPRKPQVGWWDMSPAEIENSKKISAEENKRGGQLDYELERPLINSQIEKVRDAVKDPGRQ